LRSNPQLPLPIRSSSSRCRLAQPARKAASASYP
jgi:hypothetical protein